MVLIELANADANGPLDISAEQARAEDLVSETRLYRQTAARTGEPPWPAFWKSWSASWWILPTSRRASRRRRWRSCGKGCNPKESYSKCGCWVRKSSARKRRRTPGPPETMRKAMIMMRLRMIISIGCLLALAAARPWRRGPRPFRRRHPRPSGAASVSRGPTPAHAMAFDAQELSHRRQVIPRRRSWRPGRPAAGRWRNFSNDVQTRAPAQERRPVLAGPPMR